MFGIDATGAWRPTGCYRQKASRIMVAANPEADSSPAGHRLDFDTHPVKIL